jgi:hypothetical protein
MESKCKQCNGSGTVIVEEMQVIGMDGEYDWVFDVPVQCGCQEYAE